MQWKKLDLAKHNIQNDVAYVILNKLVTLAASENEIVFETYNKRNENKLRQVKKNYFARKKGTFHYNQLSVCVCIQKSKSPSQPTGINWRQTKWIRFSEKSAHADQVWTYPCAYWTQLFLLINNDGPGLDRTQTTVGHNYLLFLENYFLVKERWWKRSSLAGDVIRRHRHKLGFTFFLSFCISVICFCLQTTRID